MTWKNESQRHSLAARGIKNANKFKNFPKTALNKKLQERFQYIIDIINDIIITNEVQEKHIVKSIELKNNYLSIKLHGDYYDVLKKEFNKRNLDYVKIGGHSGDKDTTFIDISLGDII